MNKQEEVFLTPSQFTITLISVVIGVGILSLPNAIIKDAKQDAWISSIIGSIYPIYLVLIANYLCKKFPKDNIVILSKRFLGNIIGNILSFIFITFFIFNGTGVLSGYVNFYSIYAVSYLKPYQIILPTLVVIAYIVSQGLKPLGKINEILFYLTLILFFIPIESLIYGSILNIMPILHNNTLNVVKASKATAFSYGGMEIIFFIYPFLEDNKKLLKCSFISIFATVSIYTWIIFMTIYYLGIEAAPKYFFPVVVLSESVMIPVINSFRYVFVTLWALISLKCVMSNYFAVSFGLNQVIKKIEVKSFAVIIYPVFCLITLKYGNITNRFDLLDKITPLYVLFNIMFISVIALLAALKKGDNNEKI